MVRSDVITFAALDIVCDQDLPMSIRRRVCNQCVLFTIQPKLGLQQRNCSRSTTIERAMERKMLIVSLRDIQKGTYIRPTTKFKDIIVEIKEMKWSWVGHIKRRTNSRWTLRSSEWQTHTGKRRRGRQKRRWRDELAFTEEQEPGCKKHRTEGNGRCWKITSYYRGWISLGKRYFIRTFL